MKRPTFTHKGWLGIAPIHTCKDGINVEARHLIFEPILTFSIWMAQFTNDIFDTNYAFPIRITGVIK